MKARPDLTADSTGVKSSPNNYYIDPLGNINELEDEEEQILFGSDEKVDDWLALLPESDLLERSCRVAGDPLLNPHLMAVNAFIGMLDGLNESLVRFNYLKAPEATSEHVDDLDNDQED